MRLVRIYYCSKQFWHYCYCSLKVRRNLFNLCKFIHLLKYSDIMGYSTVVSTVCQKTVRFKDSRILRGVGVRTVSSFSLLFKVTKLLKQFRENSSFVLSKMSIIFFHWVRKARRHFIIKETDQKPTFKTICYVLMSQT